jgi:hypothetical protein
MVNISKITAKQVKTIYGSKTTKTSKVNAIRRHKNKAFHNDKDKIERYNDNTMDGLDRVKDFEKLDGYKRKQSQAQSKEDQKLLRKIISDKIRTAPPGSVFSFVYDGKTRYYTASDIKKKLLLDAIENGKMPEDEIIKMGRGSDAEIVMGIYNNEIDFDSFQLLDEPDIEDMFEMNISDIKKKKDGKFYKYYCKLDMDLTRYGILKQFDKEYYQNNCFYHALKAGGLSDEQLEKIKMYVKNSHVSICNLEKICNVLDIQIKLHRRCTETKKAYLAYGTEGKPLYELGMYDNHYFIFEKTNITSFAIKNYEQVKDKKNWNMYKGMKTTTKTDFISSLDLFYHLDNNKAELLTQIELDDDMMGTCYYNQVNQEITNLNYMDCDVKPFEPYQEKEQKEIKNVFFDFESTTHGELHHAYLVNYDIDGTIYKKSGYDEKDSIGWEFLNHVCKKVDKKYQIMLIAHNLRYDISFVSRFLKDLQDIKAGGKIIGMSGTFFGRVIKFKDSLALISMPLRAFPKTFGLESKKEVIPYEMYNDYIEQCFTDKDPFVDIDLVCNKYFNNPLKKPQQNEDDKVQFKKNINEWKLNQEGFFNILKYADIYCKYDVQILRDGYNTFRTWITELYGIDINKIYSISGLADRVLKAKGCYDGCYSLGGKVRKYLSDFVVGGRTMLSENKKNKEGNFEDINFDVNGKEQELKEIRKLIRNISDFDGVSLYPSSMYRIDGFMMGKPKIIKDDIKYNELKKYDYYFVEIKINSVGVNRKFSLMSEKNEDKIRMFHNDFVGKIIKVDKTTLEDLITFQKIEFDVVRGYYFNDGFNKKINTVISEMFNERLKKKKEKNPIQIVYKLIMNGAYGKSILKEQENETRYFNSKKEGIEYMIRNYNNIVEGVQLTEDNKFMVKSKKEIDDHFNYCHIGCSILSMSKRIMNEVICTAEDAGIDIYYQDTDSMHLNTVDIKKLEKIYNKKYKRELIGANLGQFHSDFEMDGGVGDIHALGSIFLGKKCYIDVLEDEKKNIGAHIRLKGISQKSILYTAQKKYGYETDVMNYIKLYYDLYNGRNIMFDLTCDNNDIKFECFDLVVKTKLEFKREIKF